MKLYLRTNAHGNNIVEVHFENQPTSKDWDRLKLHVEMIADNFRDDEGISAKEGPIGD